LSLRDLVNTKPKRERFTRTLDGKQVRRMKKRGYDAERELVQMFRRVGFEALRIPVSAPSNEPLPDIFAVRGDAILACEVKSQERYVYFKRGQVEKLQRFLDVHRLYPKKLAVLAAKFKYQGWAFLIADKPMEYSLRIGQGISFRDLLKSIE